jgi:ABC-type antimicrobial peptide transport system permease subunit
MEPLTGWGLTVRERASLEERRGAVERWTRRYASIGWGAGTAAAVLALIGTALTVGRRVREEAPEIALRRAVGATRPRLLLRYLAFGLRVGALGAAIGCWAALFAVDAIVPEGFSRPGALASLFLPVALALTLTAGLAAAGGAAAGLRGTPREGLEG